MTPDWSRPLEVAGEHLLWALAVGTTAVFVLAGLALLWERLTRADRPRGAYYVGRRDATGFAVYFVAYSHIARIIDPRARPAPEPAWGAGTDPRPLAAAMLRHHSGGREPADRQVSALGMWLEIQPPDGFVLERAELAQIVGEPFAGRRRLTLRAPTPSA